MDSHIFRKRLQGSKPNELKSFLYHWKSIKTQMSKMGLHDPFGHLKHKLWPKERSGIKLTIWLPTIKSQELTLFPYVQVVCDIPQKVLDKGYNFASDFISIRGLHAKLWGPKVKGIPTFGNFGNPGTKCHLNVGLVGRHKVYYKGEGDGFPQVRVVVSLLNLSLPVVCLSTKSAPTMH